MRTNPSRRTFFSIHSTSAGTAFGVLLAAVLWVDHAHAQVAPNAQTNGQSAPAERQNAVPAQSQNAEDNSSGPVGSIWTRSNLLGEIGGLRPFLGIYGITLGLSETSEVFGNATGGIHQGADYDGLTTMNLAIDTNRAFGLEGGTFNISAFQIHGRSLSADNLGTLQTASGIEATRSTRLWELWYQQTLFNGAADVKIGQQSLDQEFYVSSGSSLFINTMMGWPLIPSVDQYAGGPAYPLSSLGVRLRVQPTGNITVLGGVFDDNPPGGPFNDDSQIRGAEQSGAAFNLNTGALVYGEIQYALNQPATGDMALTPESSGLPGLYKLGAWFDSGAFPDQRFDNSGLPLASPDSSGAAQMRRHNYSIYGVADQTVWRPANDSARSVSLFARIMGAPSDRNLVDFSANGGVTMKAPFLKRPNDTAGVGFGVGRLSTNATGFDQDVATFTQTSYPKRSTETFIEVTYQYQIAPWWQVQPDFQYVFLPGGGVQNPLNTADRIGNEAVFGVRTNVTF